MSIKYHELKLSADSKSGS